MLASTNTAGPVWVNNNVRDAATNRIGVMRMTSTVIAAGTRPPNLAAHEERKPLVKRSFSARGDR
ncbi:hypothetical protein GZL_06939 [Streptomyces sp. 769]|nr:hypothetical protein GZL_06939 [Streptomyces sp. 769]